MWSALSLPLQPESQCYDHVRPESNQLGRKHREAIQLSLGKTSDMLDTNPAAPHRMAGPKHSVRPGDDLLPLPSGKSVAASSNEELRPQLARLGVPGAHTDGRDVIVERYAALLKTIHDDAGKAAVADFLAKHRS